MFSHHNIPQIALLPLQKFGFTGQKKMRRVWCMKKLLLLMMAMEMVGCVATGSSQKDVGDADFDTDNWFERVRFWQR